MKILFFIFFIFPFLCVAQDSFIVVEAQYDEYGDTESQLYINDSNGDIILNHNPTVDNEYFIDTLFLNSGSYSAELNDSYGDGWYSNINGFLRISNFCQDIIVEYSSTSNNPFEEEIIDFEVFSCSLYSPPSSDFSVSSNSTCSGEINFSDLSSSNTTSWFWDFGDGNTSTDSNPQHIYTSSGVYDVQLISTNAYGSDTSFYENLIEVNFSGNGPIPNSCTPQTQYPGSLNCGITFFQLGDYFNISSNSISGYQDFSCININLFAGEFYEFSAIHDGNTSQNFSIWIDFDNNGVFDLPDEEIYVNIATDSSQSTIQIPSNSTINTPLRLRIMSDNTFQGGLNPCTNPVNGQAEDYSVLISINTNPPVSNFTSDKNFTCDGGIQFTDLSTNIPYSWNWNFGDGNTSQMQNPFHNYTESGSYDVELITINNYGSDTIFKNQYIEVDNSNVVLPPSCNPLTINHFGDYGILNVEFANINNSSSDGEEGYVDFSCEQQAYVSPGNTYILNVTNGSQNPHDTKAWIDFDNNGIFSSNELVMEQLNVNESQEDILIPESVTNSPIRLRIMSDLVGNDNSACDDVSAGQIEDYGIIIDLCSISSNENVVSISDSFCQSYIFNQDTLSDPGTYYDTLSNQLGCDSVVILSLYNDTAIRSSTDYQFICRGDSLIWMDGINYYTQNSEASFNLVNNNGCDSIVYLDLTLNDEFNLSFYASQTEGTAPYDVGFQNQTPDLSNYNFTWDFGDGTIISDNNSTVYHTFDSSGFWTVTLFAENSNNGCEDLLVKEEYVLILPSSDPCFVNPLNISISLENISDCEANNTSAIASVNGGHFPYSYSWSNGDTTSSILGVSNGKYLIEVTDSLDCILTDSITIEEPLPLEINLEGNNSTSCNFQNGTISSIISGGLNPYTFNWNTGQNSQNLELLSSGEYILTVTDAVGCTESNQFEIFSPLPPSFDVNLINENDCETNNVIASVIVEGDLTYSYWWSNGENTSFTTNLSSGLAIVEVSDSLGCFTIDSIFIEELIPPVIELDGENPSECGSDDGIIYTNISVGTPPYSFNWNNGQTSQNLDSLQSGEYMLTFIDSTGCLVNSEYELLSPELPTLEIESTSNSSCQSNDATANAIVTGGSGSYSYLWINGDQESSINELFSGFYSVIVTDDLGCSVNGFVNISAIGAPELNVISENISCYGLNDGYIYASGSGGVEPYFFSWNDGSTDSIQTGLSSGAYLITLIDGNDCEVTELVNINSPEEIEINFTVTDLKCNGGMDGSIETDLSGGTPPFNYLWSNGSVEPSIYNISSGEYGLTLMDSTNCIFTDSIVVYQPNPISINFNVDYDYCSPNNSSIETNISGGYSPYNYLWSNGDINPNIYTPSQGAYTLIITDSNNCIFTDSINIDSYSQITVDFEITNVSCSNLGGGSIETQLVGGLPPYIYSWSNLDSTQSIFNLSSGSYVFSVTDSYNCTYDTTLILTIDNTSPQTSSIFGEIVVQLLNQYPYTVSQSLGSTYYWSTDNGAIVSGQGTNIVTAQWISSGFGEIRVVEKDNNGCYGDTVSLSVNVGSTNFIKENNYDPIKLFPNPSEDIVNIESNKYSGLFELRLFDLNGMLLKQKYANSLDLSGFSKGIYFLKIIYDNKSDLLKVVKN